MKQTLLLLFVFFSFSIVIFPFQTTSLKVTVIDPNSDPVLEPTIRLKRGNSLIEEFVAPSSKHSTFTNLKRGEYLLEVEAKGFTPVSETIKVVDGENSVVVKLALVAIHEDVDIKIDQREKDLDANDGPFTDRFTPKQVEKLPDNPELLSQLLKNMAGPDATVRVDGKEGANIPPKEKIASVRIVRTSFDSEYHEAGGTYIEILTKAGGEKFSGSVAYSFGNSALSARPYFAEKKEPSKDQSIRLSLSGPLIKNKASFDFFSFAAFASEQNYINATLPNGVFRDSLMSPRSNGYYSGSINYNLLKDHTMKFSFEFSPSQRKNQGAGGLSLAERAFESRNNNFEFGVKTSGMLGKRVLHDFRFEYTRSNSETIPNSKAQGILVLGAFSAGGSGNNRTGKDKSFTITENLVFGTEKVTTKFGVELGNDSRYAETEANINGTFTFSTLDDYTNNRPRSYSQQFEARTTDLSLYRFSTYLQNDIKLSKKFMVNLGLRYEMQTRLKDWNNFAPRIGFSYSPFKEPTTTIRGGAGIYYEWFSTEDIVSIVDLGANQPPSITIYNPSYPDPFLNATPVNSVRTIYNEATNIQSPVHYVAIFGVSRKINKFLSINATYTFDRAIHRFRSRETNAPIAGVRPNPALGRQIQVESSGYLNMQEFKIAANSFVSEKFYFFFNYRYSKRTSDSDGTFFLPMDNYNIALDRGRSRRDRPNQVSAALNYSITDAINFGTFIWAASNNPYSITTGYDNNLDTQFTDRPPGVARNSEQKGAYVSLSADLSYTLRFGKASADDTKTGSTVVVIGSGGGGISKLDKKTRYSIQFNVGISNILNLKNLDNYVGNLSSPKFGEPTTAGAPRSANLGVRFSF